MFTASHNPPAYNGLKLCRAGARPVGSETGLAEIREQAERGIVEPPATTSGVVRATDLLEEYLAHLLTFADAGSMPGFSFGMEKVSRDEQRHIGFGVKVLSELFEESEECKAAAVEMLREVPPYTLAVMVPPNWDERYTTAWGFTLEDIYAFGMRSVEAKWNATGYPLTEMPPGIYPFDPEMPHAERAERQIKLLRAGVLGEPNGKPQVDHEIESILFDVVARSARADAVDRPVTIQWRFEDAEPWHVRIDNGSTRSAPGLADHPDITLRTSWAEWVDISIRGHDAWRAMLRRKLKPRGSLRQLARMQKIFPPRPAPIE